MLESSDTNPSAIDGFRATKSDFPGGLSYGNDELKKESKKWLVRLIHKFCKSDKVRAGFQVNLDSVYAKDHIHVEDVSSRMPKLPRLKSYYTEPSLKELEKKERAEPGFCTHVNDFVVGRRGYGFIRFFGETDVSGLDIASVVQFHNLKLVVYPDHTKKPPIGQGLNKPAQVTLENVRFVGTREEFIDKLKRKAKEIEAEFISYDLTWEWTFKVPHF